MKTETETFRTEPVKYKITSMRHRKPWRGRKVNFPWPGWKHGLDVNIYCRTEYKGDPGRNIIVGYEVNWGALGGSSPDQTRIYARAMVIASREADRLTRKYKGREDTL